MKKIILIIFIAFPFCAFAQLKVLTPEKEIRPNSPFKFEYHAPFQSTPVRVHVGRFTWGQNMQFDEIQLTKGDNAYSGTYVVPENVKVFALLLEVGDSIDNNNGQGFIFPIGSDNTKDPSPDLYKAKFYATKDRSAKKYLQIDPDRTKSLDVYRKYFKSNPALKNKFAVDYLSSLLAFEPQGKEVMPLFKTTFNRLKNDKAPEDSLIEIADLFLIDVKNKGHKKIYDSLYKVIVAAYPKGYNAASTLVVKLNRSKNIDSIETIFPTIRNTFSEADFTTYPLNYYYTNLITHIVKKYPHDYNKILHYYSYMTEPVGQTMFWAYLANDLSGFKESYRAADSVILLAINKGDSLVKDSNFKPMGTTKTSWVQYYTSTYLAGFYAAYADILYLEGKYPEALQNLEKYNSLSNNNIRDAGVNANYAKILNANKNFKLTLEKGKEFISANAGSSGLVKQMAIAQNELHPGSDTASFAKDRLAEIKEVKYKDVKSLLVDLPSTNFKLKDLKGNEVELEKLKGKIVVLDFWATWCAPCKKSFPGMQRAVYKYMNDKDVVFLFIDTWEQNPDTSKTKETIRDYMQTNQYTFQVLMDEKTNDTFRVVTDYKVEGIPTKFVLDKTGKVRFKTLGVHNTDEEVAEEISTMIDMLKEDEAKLN